MLKSLEDNLFAAIGKRNIAELKTRDLLVPIKAVESSGRLEVAARLQQRTTAIMRFAVQSGLIDYNPAQEIAGAVAAAKRQYRAALELNRIPELLHRIEHYSGRSLTRLAVELTLLVFIRSSELRFARWAEVVLKRLCGRFLASVSHWKESSILSVVQRCGLLILFLCRGKP